MTAYRIGRLCAITSIVLLITGTSGPESAETVRVKLFSGRVVTEAEILDTGNGRLTVYDDSGPLATLDDGLKLDFDIWNEYLRARWRSGNAPVARAVVKSSSGMLKVRVGDESRTYRGSIELTLDADIEKPGLLVVNEVDLADYVSSVLPSEYGFPEPEGMKAQAIVIRTYALRAQSQRQGRYDLTDDTGSQVYRGAASETAAARDAVRATSGMTITYDGELIEAVYSAHCGGYSANNEDVWNSKPVPYLRGRKDPYDKDAPVAHWQSVINKKDLLEMFSRTYDLKVKDISVAEHASGGRVTSVRLDAKKKDVVITAQNFRAAVTGRFGPAAVKSTIFDIKKDGDVYRFSGKGLGHGVGLCQWGAAAQAKAGRSYEDILNFYYKDVKIEGYHPQPAVATATLADPSQTEKPVKGDQGAKRDGTPPKEKVDRPTPNEKSRKGGDRKLTGRRVGW